MCAGIVGGGGTYTGGLGLAYAEAEAEAPEFPCSCTSLSFPFPALAPPLGIVNGCVSRLFLRALSFFNLSTFSLSSFEEHPTFPSPGPVDQEHIDDNTARAYCTIA